MTDDNIKKDTDILQFFDEAPPYTDDDFFTPGHSQRDFNVSESGGREILNAENPQTGLKSIHGLKERENKGAPTDLEGLLRYVFHFDSFRPYQQKVCESVLKGNDLLLVMPTGSGKSLCYQLPGLARSGTTLVVSPLIALMEDQVLNLKSLGLNAERIHSGRTKPQSRQVSADYLRGNLDFLFIAPERLAVPGFPEMLAKRRPSLIAIDEAHCISQWGHDFRPDYRLMSERLPLLMPAPVIAMTATATPRVQDDIVRQLEMKDPDMHIHGFRRTNISIELVEMLPSDRTGKALEILRDNKSRPAIIYAPTRQKAEALAEELKNRFPTSVYHAGLSPDVRDRVQASFMSGGTEVIVATIAFGMGIDKRDIRTVIHTAMPGSIEGYYQEIGRAGRDGKPSRAVLLYSYGDRRLHKFFHEKSYPHEYVLKRIFSMLTKEKMSSDRLREALRMEQDEFDAALDKLWIHGGARVDPDESVTLGRDNWHISYNRQRDHRLSQIDEIFRFTDSFSCRMLYLVRHFGDREDSGTPCGICDLCAPQKHSGSLSRIPDQTEALIISGVISGLRDNGSMATGRLYNTACPGAGIARTGFERLLRSLVKAGLITLSGQSFEKHGETIQYNRAELAREGYSLDLNKIPSLSLPLGERFFKDGKGATPSYKRKEKKIAMRPVSTTNEDLELYMRLKEWRLALAKRQRVPAFRIFSNRVLENLVADLPTTHDELLMVEGVGPRFDEKFGNEVIGMVKEYLRRQ